MHQWGTCRTGMMRVDTAVGVAAPSIVVERKMGVASVVAVWRPPERTLEVGIGAVMLLLGERMRACCCFNPANKWWLLGQILMVLVLNQLPQGFSTRRWGLLVMVVVSFYEAS